MLALQAPTDEDIQEAERLENDPEFQAEQARKLEIVNKALTDNDRAKEQLNLYIAELQAMELAIESRSKQLEQLKAAEKKTDELDQAFDTYQVVSKPEVRDDDDDRLA